MEWFIQNIVQWCLLVLAGVTSGLLVWLIKTHWPYKKP